jgi:hypothetical protein
MPTITTSVVALLLVVGVLWPGTTHATPLVIDHGDVRSIGIAIDTFWDFGGTGFSVQGVQQGHFIIGTDPGTAFGISLGSEQGAGLGVVTVSGVGTCPPYPADSDVSISTCGVLDLEFPQILIPPDLLIPQRPSPDIDPVFSATVPFTATGHFNLNGGTQVVDVVGQGFLTFTHCAIGSGEFDGEPGGCPGTNAVFGLPTASFVFVAPEPSTLLLAGFGLAITATVSLIRRRRPHTRRRTSMTKGSLG